MRAVIGGDEDERVFELAGGAQGFDEAADDLVHLQHRVFVGMAGGGFAEEFFVRVVVEVGAARAVIE